MSNDYNILADYIVSDYIDRISGNDIGNTFVDNADFDRVMTGMLAENRAEMRLSGGYKDNEEKRFESVPSMSISFVIKNDEKCALFIKPRGLLFYNIEPDYDKTVDYVIQRYSERDNTRYQSIRELMDIYPTESFELPLTYRKIDLSEKMGDGIQIRLDSLPGKSFQLQGEIGERLGDLAGEIMDEIRITDTNHVKFCDLLTQERFNAKIAVRREPVYPRWGIDVYCSVFEEGENTRFLLQLVNTTAVDATGVRGYIPKIFNAGLAVRGNCFTAFQEIELDCFVSSFKEREPVYVVAENTSAFLDKDINTIFTDNVPKYYQNRLKTKDELSKYAAFDELINEPIESLTAIWTEMMKDYAKCQREFSSTSFRSKKAKNGFREALENYEHEINRFKKGIEQIQYKDFVKKAFIYMNETFMTKLDGETRSIPGWRLFQLVFIVSMIPEIIRSEYKTDSTIAETDIEVANLLYFPTGGGKTEAFLGACVFAMFFDRIRGKNDGVTSFLKYPLRLLAVQQLDRVLTVVMKANIVRERKPQIKTTTPFRVGFFAGKENTPNKIESNEKMSSRGNSSGSDNLIVEADPDMLNEWYRFIDTCPCCGKKMVNVVFNKDSWTLEHRCDNPDCKIEVLPLYIVDDEIYRYLPSVIVSTIDKLSLLGTTNSFRSLFGQVKIRCSVHGYSVTGSCNCKFCKNDDIKAVPLLKDPVPTLFIQDELHLVNESLGTFDAHYESFIDYYAKALVPESQSKQIRFVGATATISMYKDHIRNLYHMEGRRFPCEYPSVKSGEDFYSYTDKNDVSRILLGYAPYGRSITDGMWQSVYTMRLVVYELFRNAEALYKKLVSKGFSGSFDVYKEMVYDYWIELVYNNVKQDAVELENSFKNQANNFLNAKGVPLYSTEQMTSDVDFQQVRRTLFDIQANHKNLESTNLLLATKTISHGVDEDSFNIMYFFGMPNNNAEYIQAYSRTGRKYTGIVVDIIRLMRVRDRSYLKNFVVFHQNKDDLVESVPINRWAKNAIYSTLPGILAGIIHQYYTVATGSDSFFYISKLKKHLNNGVIIIDDVVEKISAAYGCNEHEKLSLAYKEIIETEVRNVLEGIKNGTFDQYAKLSETIAKFSKDRKAPMRSLRDTEESVVISLKG